MEYPLIGRIIYWLLEIYGNVVGQGAIEKVLQSVV